MRLVLPLMLLALAVPSPAGAEDKPREPTFAKVGSTETLAALGPKDLHVELSYFLGGLEGLARRQPGVTHLRIKCHSTLPLEDLKRLTAFKQLKSLSLAGDMSFPTAAFKVVGSLSQLEQLRLSLP